MIKFLSHFIKTIADPLAEAAVMASDELSAQAVINRARMGTELRAVEQDDLDYAEQMLNKNRAYREKRFTNQG